VTLADIKVPKKACNHWCNLNKPRGSKQAQNSRTAHIKMYCEKVLKIGKHYKSQQFTVNCNSIPSAEVNSNTRDATCELYH